ncbi:hypothetical protein FJTKL_09026 [Diaporthe vaccinii]|uniref:Uncharacterized protein n=1 Tax=Diaporthe vaccinii TaxID=105482 RepID=A0ABR4EPG3_9PEZI
MITPDDDVPTARYPAGCLLETWGTLLTQPWTLLSSRNQRDVTVPKYVQAPNTISNTRYQVHFPRLLALPPRREPLISVIPESPLGIGRRVDPRLAALAIPTCRARIISSGGS